MHRHRCLLVVLALSVASVAEAQMPCPSPSAVAAATDYRAFVQPGSFASITVPPAHLHFACDTTAFLRDVFREVTRGAQTDTERAVAWVLYLQGGLYHSCFPPLDSEQQAIYHPVWILTYRATNCGQAARLVVDGFNVAGIPARVVQLRGHVAAEVYLLGAWRFVDVDVWPRGVFVLNGAGAPATLDEIIHDRSLLRHVPVGVELPQCLPRGWDYAGTFDSITYDGLPATPFVWQKTATAADLQNKYYGWNVYRACRRDDPSCR